MAKKQTTTKRNRPACDQCGKPSVVALQDFALCVDCYHRLQEANYMAEKIVDAQFTRQMHMFNLNADQIAAAVPFPETVARFRIPAPIYHHQGDLALQNFNVSNSIVGSLNAGTIQSLDVTLSNIRAFGNEHLAETLRVFTQALLDSQELDATRKNAALEQTAFLAEQVAQPPSQRKPGMIRTALANVKDAVSAVKGLATLWQEQVAPALESLTNNPPPMPEG